MSKNRRIWSPGESKRGRNGSKIINTSKTSWKPEDRWTKEKKALMFFPMEFRPKGNIFRPPPLSSSSSSSFFVFCGLRTLFFPPASTSEREAHRVMMKGPARVAGGFTGVTRCEQVRCRGGLGLAVTFLRHQIYNTVKLVKVLIRFIIFLEIDKFRWRGCIECHEAVLRVY